MRARAIISFVTALLVIFLAGAAATLVELERRFPRPPCTPSRAAHGAPTGWCEP